MATLQQLRADGIEIDEIGGSLRVVAGSTKLSPELLDAIRADKITLLNEIRLERSRLSGILTDSQSRTLSLLERTGRSPAEWVIDVVATVPGTLDPARFRSALALMVARHDVCRTQLVHTPNGARMRLGNAPQLEVIDAAGDAEAVVAESIEAAVDPFRESLRVRLIHSPDASRIVVLANHLLFDGVSLRILLRELMHTYQRIAGGRGDAQLPPALSYMSYAEWIQRVARARTNEWRAHWASKLDGRVVDAGLECDRVERALRRSRSALSTHLLLDDAALSHQSAVSDFSREIAAIAVAAHALSGEDDVTITTPMSTRVHPSSAAAVGLYSNGAPLALRVHANDSLRDVCLRVAEEIATSMRSPIVPEDSWRKVVPHRSGRVWLSAYVANCDTDSVGSGDRPLALVAERTLEKRMRWLWRDRLTCRVTIESSGEARRSVLASDGLERAGAALHAVWSLASAHMAEPALTVRRIQELAIGP